MYRLQDFKSKCKFTRYVLRPSPFFDALAKHINDKWAILMCINYWSSVLSWPYPKRCMGSYWTVCSHQKQDFGLLLGSSFSIGKKDPAFVNSLIEKPDEISFCFSSVMSCYAAKFQIPKHLINEFFLWRFFINVDA